MQEWNIPTERAEREKEENGIICLIIMFTPIVNAIKMWKQLIFCIFLLIAEKNHSQFG